MAHLWTGRENPRRGIQGHTWGIKPISRSTKAVSLLPGNLPLEGEMPLMLACPAHPEPEQGTLGIL